MPIRNRTARQHNFATVPRADIPRSKFAMRQTRKQAFDASDLIPIMVEEILPGDTWSHREHIFARLATPIAPAVDDIDLETFYFFVPNRITWKYQDRWEKFISGTDVNLTVPTISAYETFEVGEIIPVGSVFDHMGIAPGTYTNTGGNLRWNVLPIWAYFTIWNEWFRDQNLQPEWVWPEDWVGRTYDWITATPPDESPIEWDTMPLRVNKRSDYFTRSLPWPQKGEPVQIPLGATAQVIPDPDQIPTFLRAAFPGGPAGPLFVSGGDNDVGWQPGTGGGSNQPLNWDEPGLLVDLQTATAATINTLRLAFQTQKLLERDARGGSRYVEQLLSHFGVRSPDYRLQRPEYLGGSRIPITVNPVAQTATYDAEPANAESPIGNLGAEMHVRGSHKTFTYAATEHGFIIGLACVRATPTYQQGVRRHWLRETRLEYYFPVFSHLGEQAVRTQEIYQAPNSTYTNEVWGYQERWAEYRYTPNEITGVLRSTAAQPLDWWHYAEEFDGEPALNADFITDKTKETLARSLATAPSAQWSAQIIMDIQHDSNVARLMPTYSVPGLIDHF